MLHSPSLQQAFQEVIQAEAAISAHLKQHLARNDVFQEAAGTQPIFPPDLQDVRKRLANAAAYLFQISIDPREYLEQLSASNQHLVCLRWIINLDILQHIPVTGSISYKDLATKASVPEHQLKSVIRMAAAHGFLHERSPMMVSHSPTSALVATDDSFLNWARWLTNYSVPSAYRFSEATQKWGVTEQKNQTSFNIAMDVDLPFFGYLKSNAKMNSMFSSYMRNVAASDATGFKHLISGFEWANLSPGSTVVDVGGSGGHASRALATTFPELRFIVQDLPDTIENAKATNKNGIIADDRIRFMPHDFFTTQPVTDADIYLLRMIIHDWPEESAITILSHIRDALKKPGARIVIMDTILPQPGTVTLLQERQLRVRDLTMMQVFNAKEREYETWKNLIEKVGMKILSVNQPDGSNMGLLEVGLADPMKHNIPAQPPKSTTTNSTTPHINGLRPNGVNGAHGITDVTFDSAKTASVDARKHPGEDLPVLIMGAGISGLCLAQYLHKHHVPFLVFERDPSADYRPQGYRLKLEGDAATALQESLTKEVYAAFEASCAESYIGETDYDPISGSCIKSRSGGGLAGRQGLRATYTVDRSVFRQVLMTGIRDRIHFGRECCSYHVGEDGRSHVTAIFKDGDNNNTVVTGRFLVGADGTRSIVRKQLVPQHKYLDTGAVCIYGKTTITQDLLRRYPAKALRWMTVCTDTAPLIQSILIGESPLTLLSEPIRFSRESRAKATVPLPEDYVYWVLIGRREMFFDPADTTSASSSTNNSTSSTDKAFDEEAAKMSAALSLALTEEWDSKLRSLFDLQDPRQTSTMRVVSAPPKIPAWETSPSVTLMGDAVHAMSPCGGVGANTALRDAAELGKLLVASSGATNLCDQQPSQELEDGRSLDHGRIGEQASSSRSFISAVAAFEEAMRKRAFGGIMRSFVGSKRMFDQRPFEELAVIED